MTLSAETGLTEQSFIWGQLSWLNSGYTHTAISVGAVVNCCIVFGGLLQLLVHLHEAPKSNHLIIALVTSK